MCSKCDELDRKIEHYQRLSRKLLDQRVLEILETLIEKYKADKKALHPESPCSNHEWHSQWMIRNLLIPVTFISNEDRRGVSGTIGALPHC